MHYGQGRFVELLNHAIHQMAGKLGGKQKFAVAETDLADVTHVGRSAVQKWRSGKSMPVNPEFTGEQLVRHCVTNWGLDKQWALAMLRATGHHNPAPIVAQLFTGTSQHLSGTACPTGPIDAHAPSYVERDLQDRIVLQAIAHDGVTITIKGPAQTGKTSMLNRIKAEAQQAGKVIAELDFREFDRASLTDPNIFYQQFCEWLGAQLMLDATLVGPQWNPALANPMNCTRYMGRHILKTLKQPLVVAMDNVDRMFEADFYADFFGMLRAWHEKSQSNALWKTLDRVLVTSTEPYLFIDDVRSPFNVGEVVELSDFRLAEVTTLNQRYRSPFTVAELQQLMDLLNGHPHLIHLAICRTASDSVSVSDIFNSAQHDYGIFRHHLESLLYRLTDGPPCLRTAMHKVIKEGRCPDQYDFFRLRGAGLVRRSGTAIVPRCQLYATFFADYL